jgi:Protein of unknown function (DUF3370)
MPSLISLLSSFSLIAQLQTPIVPTPPAVTSPPATPLFRIPLTYRLPNQEGLPPQDILPRQSEILSLQEVRSLSGKLDDVLVFNSNSPEMILNEGILLSTFPNEGKRFPKAHLGYKFQGRFDVFSHHISKTSNTESFKSLFQGILIRNPTPQPITIEVMEGASYLTRPDALFLPVADTMDDPIGTVYSGPGSRVVNDLLRGRRQGWLPSFMRLNPGESRMLLNLPIPAGVVAPSSNGRSTLIRLNSSGEVHLASMAMYAPRNLDGSERVPTLEDWQTFLTDANLAGPRDKVPTPLTDSGETTRVIYGRVAGVAKGSRWEALLVDGQGDRLKIPDRGHAFSYAISTLPKGTFGTGQVQSAPMLVRYDDTAYLANGNYGIQYNLSLPLHNSSNETQRITLSLETPLKQDMSREQVLFMNPPEPKIFFRGTVRLRYEDDTKQIQTRYVHVVQRRGQRGEPLVTLNLKPGELRSIAVDLIYPPDATPPQLITIRNLE